MCIVGLPARQYAVESLLDMAAAPLSGCLAKIEIGKRFAPIAQLDRASVYGTEGYRFDSYWVYSVSSSPKVSPNEKPLAKPGVFRLVEDSAISMTGGILAGGVEKEPLHFRLRIGGICCIKAKEAAFT